MLLPILAVLAGLILLIWSADRFVDGAACTARYAGMPPLLIGMVIVGFGTSAPEMVVSTLASLQGNPGLAIGNAFGSNITNIGLILGTTAVIAPIAMHSQILRKELPVLALVTAICLFLIYDCELSRMDGVILLVVFAFLMAWSIRQGLQQREDNLSQEIDRELISHKMSLKMALFWLFLGLVVLIISSRILVWGAVSIAVSFGVSDLIIGLTIVAIGTSLPELASSIMATRKGEHELAIGNVIGSNLFNTLTVIGIAGVIAPFTLDAEVISRDGVVMGALTLSLFLFGYGWKKKQGRLSRTDGAILLACYLGYSLLLATSVVRDAT